MAGKLESLHLAVHRQKHAYQDDETVLIHLFATDSNGSIWTSTWDVKKREQTEDWVQLNDLPDIN